MNAVEVITLKEFISMLIPSLFGAIGGAWASFMAMKIQLARHEEKLNSHIESNLRQISHVQNSADQAHARIDTLILKDR